MFPIMDNSKTYEKFQNYQKISADCTILHFAINLIKRGIRHFAIQPTPIANVND